MIISLKNKVALVTGGAKGLGAADARLLSEAGASVIITDVDIESGAALASQLGDSVSFMKHDVRSESDWMSVVSTVNQTHGGIDILVNNAGVVRFGTPVSIDMKDYRFIMETSIDGTILGCKYGIPSMIARGGGSIINMASIASIQGEPYCAAYCAAKGAVEAYTRAVAVYCAQNRLNIRCNSIHPAAIDTPMVRSAGALAAAAGMNALLENDRASLSNPVGIPEDVAHLVVYLASDQSSFTSGQRFVIDNTASITAGSVPGGGSVATI
jgi:3(or 17)beta-hydroxysteroid dehydrogenase